MRLFAVKTAENERNENKNEIERRDKLRRGYHDAQFAPKTALLRASLEITASKKLPDLASMIGGLGHDRLAYVVGQQIGSHHIHGTWPSLLLHYLDWDTIDSFRPRDHNCPTHVNQYIFVPLMVLSATKAFCRWLLNDPEAQNLVDMLQSIEDEILEVNRNVIVSDFSAAAEI